MTTVATNRQLPLVERLDPALDPVEVFRRLSGQPHVILFDSAMRHPELGRYSFVAADPIEWLEVPADGSDALSALGTNVGKLTGEFVAELPPFQGGWAGLFGYELGGSLEDVPRASIDEFGVPALAMGLYDVVVAFDHRDRSAWLISQGWPKTDASARQQRAKARLEHFRRLLDRRPSDTIHPLEQTALSIDQLASQCAVTGRSELTSNFSADGYRAAVQRAIDYIHAGDVFQVNLSQRLLHPAVSSSVDLYCRLRQRNPAPFAGYLDGGDWQIASASPERFVQVLDGHVETRPIKGTRGRARRPEADLFAGDDLRASEKDRSENIMIVDLLRNDLSRTCLADSVRVSQLCGLEMYEYVQHLVSVVEGELRPDQTVIDVLRTSFPGGSVTGAPKIRAMEIIAELEPTVRGAYCGSLGYIGVGGQMDTNILIRTITASRGWWQLPVGGGIVAQSDPQNEYEETWHKAAGMLRALQP
ncbi:MAG TPA: anthranilate synthase component I family protein [Lacipirellulaceae bacterium]|nr:anthranilate synthase component I family protein [Lacipirellulaceae bacterium]